jgi:hypothetical protein
VKGETRLVERERERERERKREKCIKERAYRASRISSYLFSERLKYYF